MAKMSTKKMGKVIASPTNVHMLGRKKMGRKRAATHPTPTRKMTKPRGNSSY